MVGQMHGVYFRTVDNLAHALRVSCCEAWHQLMERARVLGQLLNTRCIPVSNKSQDILYHHFLSVIGGSGSIYMKFEVLVFTTLLEATKSSNHSIPEGLVS